jgi:hypothetical protein
MVMVMRITCTQSRTSAYGGATVGGRGTSLRLPNPRLRTAPPPTPRPLVASTKRAAPTCTPCRTAALPHRPPRQ